MVLPGVNHIGSGLAAAISDGLELVDVVDFVSLLHLLDDLVPHEVIVDSCLLL